MKSVQVSAPVILLAALLVAMSPAVSGQSYGPEAQRLTIGAAEFRRMTYPFEPFVGQDGYMSLNPPVEFPSAPTAYSFLAPIFLPEGASIDKLCLYANDTDLFEEVEVNLVVVKLVAAGEEDAQKDVVGVSSEAALGYRRYCVDLAEVVRGRIDVDGDGILDHAAYYVRATLPYASSDLEFVSFGAVQIIWRRSVSLPPSAPTFADVPTSHLFYPFIEALAASSITGGCGSGNFCPEKPLTRGQMAVFLAKALGLHWPN
jgi:hypothetical protein